MQGESIASCETRSNTQHLNREVENVTESPKVQDNLDKAKAARRTIIRYVQLVQDEEYVGTLLDANEKVVEAIQLYDKVSPQPRSLRIICSLSAFQARRSRL